MREINITADGDTLLGVVGKQGMAVFVRAAADLGGGTLNITMDAAQEGGVKEVIGAALAAAGSGTYTTGAGARIYASLSGSTDPSIDLLVGDY